jgi:hypothetical protein
MEQRSRSIASRSSTLTTRLTWCVTNTAIPTPTAIAASRITIVSVRPVL